MLVDNNYYVAIKTSMYQENSMIKTITFAILHFSVAFSVAYILTGSIGFQRGGFGRTHRQYRCLLFS